MNITRESSGMADEDRDVIDLSEGSSISQDSVKVIIGKIHKPKSTDRVTNSTEGAGSGDPHNVENQARRKKISGAERRRRKKAKVALENVESVSTPFIRETISGNKRNRSPVEEKVTPPAKRSQVNDNQIPQQNTAESSGALKVNKSFKDAVTESLTYVIVGARDQVLNPDQVQSIMGNVVWELERFIGTPTMMPSFKGKRLGETELELRCADARTEDWLRWVVPRLKPWENASLKLMKKSEWEKKKKMVRMSVVVPWQTSGNYFLDVLRSNNPNLKTRDWDINYVELRGDSTAIFLKVDEVSAEILRHNNYKAFWLLDEIKFAPRRSTRADKGQTEDKRQEAKVNDQLVGNSKDDDRVSRSATETETSSTLTKTNKVDNNSTLAEMGEDIPTGIGRLTIGASTNDQQISGAGTEGRTVNGSEVLEPNLGYKSMEVEVD